MLDVELNVDLNVMLNIELNVVLDAVLIFLFGSRVEYRAGCRAAWYT